MSSKRFLDALKQIPLQIALLVISGLIAMFAMIIPILGFEAFAWISNGSSPGGTAGIGHIITGIIGVVASTIAMYQFMKKPGVDDAIFAQREKGDKAKVNIIYPMMIIVVSIAVYFVICYVADFQFIAGAVHYWAPAFARKSSQVAFKEIPVIWKLIPFVIVVAFEIPAMLIGYIKGFKERMAGNSLL